MVTMSQKSSVPQAVKSVSQALIPDMAGNNAYEDQTTDYILTNSLVYKVTLTSTDMIKF
jgi:hypothetical protein